MTRPRGDTDETPARQRITDAFFELLSEGGYSGVTVRSLAACANVSPNTIYYHFESIFDAARYAVESELSIELALFLVSPEGQDEGSLTRLLDDPANQRRFGRIRLVAASGNAQLTSILTEAVEEEWLQAAGIDKDCLTPDQAQDLRFIFRGAMDLLSSVETAEDIRALPNFFSRPLGNGIRETLQELVSQK